jgi:hypothetical protein
MRFIPAFQAEVYSRMPRLYTGLMATAFQSSPEVYNRARVPGALAAARAAVLISRPMEIKTRSYILIYIYISIYIYIYKYIYINK